MLERLQTASARPSVGRLRRTGRSVLAAAVAWLAVGHAALAAEREQAPASTAPSCLDELVDVYLSPLKREEGPPIRVFLKPGPPPVHLRLPRRWLRMDLMPSVYANTKDCGQKAFSGWRASYLRASDLAHGLGIPYDQPRVQDFQFFFYALDSDKGPSVDDSGDREGTARGGTWIVDPTYRGVNLSARFCLLPPAPDGSCYAHTERGMAYDTGHVRVYALAFSAATFGLPADSLMTQITMADLDRYFAFMRQVAAAVVVAPITPVP